MADQTSEKIGLALSGGGLRASFFHIGLLAQMAEQGVLKSVAVISTVSGGSIIGALYYLHLKNLLESKSDKDITDQDYVDIIKIIEVEFLEATEKNIRMNVLSDFLKNYRMRHSDYSRSDRIAELYNEYLYKSVVESLDNPVEMRALKIYPLGGAKDFHPKKHNADRKAKVPILVLNATTLNAGRNWQFTAQTMGEPPSRESEDDNSKYIHIDKKSIRLRRATGGYQNMVKEQQDMSLGHAVAASACVPGLFTPLVINYLYTDNLNNEAIVPQLVDGGVFDNQGIESLIKYKCTHFIVSDASGQMGMENEVDTDPVSVLLRVSSVLQDRVRTESLLHLIAKIGEDKIIFLDLRKGLGQREISWINEKGESAEDDKVTDPISQTFGVNPEVQEKLSLMRTDLDAFTEVEAYSLMFDAYQLSKNDLAQLTNAKQLPESSWQFTKIADSMKDPTPEYLKQLEVAKSVFGKALMVSTWLWIPIIVIFSIIVFYSWGSILQILTSPITLLAIILWLATIFISKFSKVLSFLKNLRPHALVTKRLGRALLLVLGTVAENQGNGATAK